MILTHSCIERWAGYIIGYLSDYFFPAAAFLFSAWLMYLLVDAANKFKREERMARLDGPCKGKRCGLPRR